MLDETARTVSVERLFATYLGGVMLFTGIVVHSRVVRGLDGHQLLDWLISYRRGFVRRGLSGEAISLGVAVTGMSAEVVVGLVQVSAYAAFLGGAWTLVRRLGPIPVALWPLLFSPAVFAFHVIDLSGGLRKDVLFLAVLAGSAVIVSGSGVSDDLRRWAFVGAAWMMPLLVFTHEALVAYLPYLFVLGVGVAMPRCGRIFVVLSACAAISAVLITMTVPDDGYDVAAMCRLIAEAVPRLDAMDCSTGGAVYWLGVDRGTAMDLVELQLSSSGPTYLVGVSLVVLAFVPALSYARAVLPKRSWRGLLVAMSLSWTLSSPLFVVALDWGRFVYLHAAATTLVLLAFLGSVPKAPTSACGARRRGRRFASVAFAVATAPYALLWNLNHFSDAVGGGWASLLWG